jgi:chloramphenicol 3-O-phosphotransferase
MKRSSIIIGCLTLVISVFIAFMLYRPQRGHVILITGTSSAGKSSIVRELTTSRKTPYHVWSIDEFIRAYVAKNPLEKKLVYDERTNQKVMATINRKVLDSFYTQINQELQRGNQLIVDTVLELPHEYERFFTFVPESKCTKVLVYCPPQLLTVQVQERNASGKAQERRTFIEPFGQFLAFYKLQQTSDELLIDTLTSVGIKKSLNEAIAITLRSVPQEHQKEAQEAFKQLYQEFVERFQLDTHAQIPITSINHYDLIVDSGKYTPRELAGLIRDFLKNSPKLLKI